MISCVKEEFTQQINNTFKTKNDDDSQVSGSRSSSVSKLETSFKVETHRTSIKM